MENDFVVPTMNYNSFPHKCEICERRFHCKECISRHYLTVHQESIE